MFTKKEIEEMNESTFQKSVVEPLFRAMGFHDVYDFSGGSLELGKDVVMWKEGELDERVNYGVVVKAVRISGKAKGPNTASEVLNQIRQCLTSKYADPVTGEEQKIHQCWVISSKVIEKSSIHSIETQLQDFHFDKVVRWIHPGTNLYQLIDKHLPHQAIVEQLSSIQSKLDEAMKIVPYRIVANTDNSFEIRPTHKNAANEVPFEIKTKFEFDTSTPEGRQAHDNFVQAYKTGRPTEVEGKYIKAFKLPDFVPEWLRPALTEDSKLVLGSNRVPRIIPLEMRRRLDSGEERSTGRIDFEIVHHGSEEITLKNDRQGGPLDIEFVINLKESIFRVNVTCKFVGFGAFQLLNALEFCSSLGKDGETDIVALDLGLKLVSSSRSTVNFTDDLDGHIQILKHLLLIQDVTGLPMFIPEADIKEQDLDELRKAVHIIRKGEIKVTVPEIVSFAGLEVAKDAIDSFAGEKPQSVSLDHEGGLTLSVIGNEVVFAPSAIFGEAYLLKADYEDVKRQIDSEAPEIRFSFKFVDSNAILRFPHLRGQDVGTLDSTEQK